MVFLDAGCMSACPSWINSWEGLVVLLSLEGCSEAVVMPSLGLVKMYQWLGPSVKRLKEVG